jgi:alkylhydroperoxidase/carboxymuconolactone decarboxylase family protein YurZ
LTLLSIAGAVAAEPATIEQAGQAYLREGGAPEEIEADWSAWADRTGRSVWDRPGLTRAERSLITLAMLSVLREEGPFRVHVEAGLANGLSRAQISEVVMHSAVYGGVPQALRSMRICREVFERLDAEAAEAASGGD